MYWAWAPTNWRLHDKKLPHQSARDMLSDSDLLSHWEQNCGVYRHVPLHRNFLTGPSHELHLFLITLVHSGKSASRKVVKFWSPSTISFHCVRVSWWVGDLKGDLNLLPLGSRWVKLIKLGVHLGIAKWRVPRLVILSFLHFPFD